MDSPQQPTMRAQEMYALIANYLISQLTQKEFCRQHNLSKSTFRYWLNKYQKHYGIQQSDRLTSQSFLPIKIKSATRAVESGTACVIELPNGINIRLEGVIDYNFFVSLIHGDGQRR